MGRYLLLTERSRHVATESLAGVKAVDSLSAYEFKVELDGQPVGGIFSVAGLTSFALAGDFPPLVITKMVQQDPNTPFNAWTRASRAGGKPTRNLAIVAMDEGVETRRWVYHSAYITAISFSAFDTASSELIEEKITIQAERVEEIWP
jgi:hypothetical protein